MVAPSPFGVEPFGKNKWHYKRILMLLESMIFWPQSCGMRWYMRTHRFKENETIAQLAQAEPACAKTVAIVHAH